MAIAVAAVLAMSGSPPADADDDGDHDRARELHEQGEIQALHDILQVVAERVPGEVVSIDLVRTDHRWIYRIQVVDAAGRRKIVDVDARGATVLRDGSDD
jgi:uncharacterized membrane protein YkoI